MEALTDATISGFNAYVKGLTCAEDEDVFITLITFNDDSTVVWD